jgi:hypothetical protein
MIKFKLDLRLNKQSIHRTDRIKSLALIVCAMFEELEDYLKQVNGTTVIFGENYCIRETLLQIASGLKTFPAGKVANTELEEQATEKPEQPQIGTKVQ